MPEQEPRQDKTSESDKDKYAEYSERAEELERICDQAQANARSEMRARFAEIDRRKARGDYGVYTYEDADEDCEKACKEAQQKFEDDMKELDVQYNKQTGKW